MRRRLSAPTSGRAATASLATPLKAVPALPARPSALARAIRAGEAAHGGCVANVKRVLEVAA